MRMSRHLGTGNGVILLPALFAQNVTTANMNRHLSAQIRQRKINAPIAAKRGPQQTEECLVLIYRQELAVTHRPTLRSEVETHYSDFRKKWFCHVFLLPE